MSEGSDVNDIRYFEQLLLENIPEVQFVHPLARNQSQQIFPSHDQSKAVELSFQNTYDSFQIIFQAASIGREILAEEKWRLTEVTMVSMFQGRLTFWCAGHRVVQEKTRKQQHTDMKLKSL